MVVRRRLMLLLAGLLVCVACSPAPPPSVREIPSPEPDPVEAALRFDLPVPELSSSSPLELWATYYYVPVVTHDESGHALRTMESVSLGPKLSTVDWCEAAMQGTVLIHGPGSTSVTYNYAGTTDEQEVDCTEVYPKHPAIGRSRYTKAVGPWGDGVENMILIPYRSIAVDPDTIPFGTAVYIPAARGAKLTLPDGGTAVHDGWFFAADRGGAIKGTHIDVYVGVGKHNPFANWVTSKSTETFEAHIASEPGLDRLSRAHRRP